VARGMIVAVVITIGAVWLIGMPVAHPAWALTFVVLGSILMGALGMVAAVFANKFDQLSAITNFLVTPLAFLSGTFYSIEALPPLLQTLCHWNPFFYIIDGVRFGTIGISDSNPWLGLAVVLGCSAVILSVVWYWLKIGYRLKA
jgi:ABC-2 type transport system permease protein